MYSQNDEERHIVEHLSGIAPADGRFLDIGAYDGKTLSNTYRLVELGWGGLCIEPSPYCFTQMLNIHRGNERVQLLNTAVIPGAHAAILPFHDSQGDAVSTLVDSHVARWSSSVKYRSFFTQAMPLRAVFAQFGVNYDFINLDVESLNIDLFRELPFDQLTRLKLICVEHDGHYPEMLTELAKHGFRLLAQNGENIIAGR
jgi:FkbM family methyltransferase